MLNNSTTLGMKFIAAFKCGHYVSSGMLCVHTQAILEM
jgi:hypothetical protein